jgi:hypothetical protein
MDGQASLYDRARQHYAVHNKWYKYAAVAVVVVVIIVLAYYTNKYRLEVAAASSSHALGRPLAGPNGGWSGNLGAGGPGLHKVTDAGGSGSNVHRDRDYEDFGDLISGNFMDPGSGMSRHQQDQFLQQQETYSLAHGKGSTDYADVMGAARYDLSESVRKDTYSRNIPYAMQEWGALQTLQATPDQLAVASQAWF